MKIKVGERFGQLEILSLEGNRKLNSGQNNYVWLCKCDCGNTCIKTSRQLLKAKKPSCGCIKSNTKHGMSKTRLYNIWSGMKQRCYARKWSHHRAYHKNKIKMCKEWKESFLEFYNWAIGSGYQDNLTIDRIDNYGNYEPSNCRWADRIMQENNTSRNVWISNNGETHTIAEWARKLGITKGEMRYMLQKRLGL
jgi:hypothetical protein